jgi:exodeoxyribonuclease VII small subunit
MMAETKKPGFSEAMAEVEDILRRLENDEVEIDSLGDEVKKAVELVNLCRGQLKATEMEVQKFVADLQQPSGEAGEL